MLGRCNTDAGNRCEAIDLQGRSLFLLANQVAAIARRTSNNFVSNWDYCTAENKLAAPPIPLPQKPHREKKKTSTPQSQ